MRRPRDAAVSIFALAICVGIAQAEIIDSRQLRFELSIVTDELRRPWGMVFLPNGDLLVTEHEGRVRLVRDEALVAAPVALVPGVERTGQGGLLGIALHPRFAANGLVYLAHTAGRRGAYGTEVVRGRYLDARLTEFETVFRALPKSGGGAHFGSRLLFAPDGSLFVSLGERNEREAAQALDDHRGAMIRINDDGSVPSDNPFLGRAEVRPEIYSYGHRNVQGLAMRPGSGDIWLHEHGPQGGDELNRLLAGANYGWPVITHGVNYVIGTKIGEGTSKPGMEQPVHVWVPSIAPSGMSFYAGAAFPAWQGDLFLGSLKFGLLVRLELDGDEVVAEERLLDNRYGRIRDVVEGPEGFLYLLSDDGKLMRIAPPADERG